VTEPVTVNRGLVVPLTGDLVGSWGTAAINTNMNALDGILGGFATISLSAATTFALTTSGAVLTPGTGPTQSDNALIKFTGSLAGNAVVQFTEPGFYIIHNACTVGAFKITLSPASGGGNSICAPPGRKAHVFFDGTDMDYVDMPEVGSALDLHGATALPAWITGCSVQPYLIKDGSTYSTSIFPALGAILGSTFGGNGITTFGVPDELNRVRIPVATSGTTATRVTQTISGINGTTMGSAGGDQSMQQHSHAYTDPGHTHQVNYVLAASVGAGPRPDASPLSGSYATQTSTIGITISSTGSGSSQNMPPAIISFLPLIKT